MTKNVDAVYENGMFRPTSELGIDLANGTRVRLTVEPVAQHASENILDLAANVYAGLSEEDVADIERIAFDRTDFFFSLVRRSLDEQGGSRYRYAVGDHATRTGRGISAQVYLSSHSQLSVSIVTRYEILARAPSKECHIASGSVS